LLNHDYEDIALIKTMGFDHVRFTIEPAPLMTPGDPGKLKSNYLQYFDAAFDMLLAQGVAVIPPLASLQKALSFNPPPLRAHVHLANLYAKEHHYKEAVEELRKYLDAAPTIPDGAELESVEAKWGALAESP
jgi:hypothetical protein